MSRYEIRDSKIKHLREECEALRYGRYASAGVEVSGFHARTQPRVFTPPRRTQARNIDNSRNTVPRILGNLRAQTKVIDFEMYDCTLDS